jgi:hypothetical protein
MESTFHLKKIYSSNLGRFANAPENSNVQILSAATHLWYKKNVTGNFSKGSIGTKI